MSLTRAGDGAKIQLLVSNEYGQAGQTVTVGYTVADSLIAASKATFVGHSTGTAPANKDSGFASVQAAVYAKAGLTVPNSDQFANSSLDRQIPQPVKIKIRSTGLVISVHHEVAIQKVLGGHADLV